MTHASVTVRRTYRRRAATAPANELAYGGGPSSTLCGAKSASPGEAAAHCRLAACSCSGYQDGPDIVALRSYFSVE